ncbi:MAG TPA: TrbC/VirB2 family protein [Patescibacteria group bacterium]|nr:TrbC/VirB2 family protein [Patescibacteria group bacterium]
MKKLALTFPGGESINDPPSFAFASGNISNIINDLIPYIFALAGLALLLILIWAGFEMMTSAGDPKKMESAKGRLTGAVIGFVIIFVAYWLIQILEVIFGLKIF